jgi:DNA-binding XRE family transcriptional regulator
VTRFSKKPNSAAVAVRGVAGAAPNVGRQLGAVARRVREGQGLTLTDVATTAGISAGMLSRLETGHVTPSLETLVALSAALGVRRCSCRMSAATRKGRRRSPPAKAC